MGLMQAQTAFILQGCEDKVNITALKVGEVASPPHRRIYDDEVVTK
jgi:hypothetical protein